MKKRVWSVLMATAMAASMVMGTVSVASAAENEELHIGISMCAIESQMWAEYQDVMHSTCDEMGVKYTEVIAENDTQKQNQQIEMCIRDRY